MTLKITLAAACALVLAACGNHAPSGDEAATAASAPAEHAATPPPAATTAMPAESTPPAASTVAAPAPAATSGNDKPAAVVEDCATTIEGNDAMQFNVGSITVPASCAKFTVNLRHAGTMPVAAMGHDVVISKESDMQGVLADGMGAGASADYVKAGDSRVVAHTKLVGGGQSTSVSFDTSKIKTGGPYEFFCSFPGHAAMMKGSISVG